MSTSNSVTLEDKTAQHIGSYSPTALRVVEFQLAAAYLVNFISTWTEKYQHGGVGQMVRTDSDRLMIRLAEGNL